MSFHVPNLWPHRCSTLGSQNLRLHSLRGASTPSASWGQSAPLNPPPPPPGPRAALEADTPACYPPHHLPLADRSTLPRQTPSNTDCQYSPAGAPLLLPGAQAWSAPSPALSPGSSCAWSGPGSAPASNGPAPPHLMSAPPLGFTS